MVNGGLKESSEKCATLPNVAPPTFTRFAQYAYSGNYEADALEGVPTAGPNGEQDNAVAKSKKQQQQEKPTDFDDRLAKFAESWYPVPVELNFVPEKNTDPRQSCTEIFLAHAKIHVFADYYGIEALSKLALHRLHRSLCAFELFPQRVVDVNELLRFCYDSEVVGLKDLASSYADCHMKTLWADHDFQVLFSEYPELSVTLMGALMEQLRRQDL